MTLKEAHDALHARLCPHGPAFRPHWLQAVGIGADQLVVYVRTDEPAARRALAGHEAVGGWPVVIRWFGEFAPLGGAVDE